MPYDKSLDKEVFADSVEFETTKITVSIFSYNEGMPKIQFSRNNRNQNTGDWGFAKLGRMTKQEIEAALPIIQKAVEKMD